MTQKSERDDRSRNSTAEKPKDSPEGTWRAPLAGVAFALAALLAAGLFTRGLRWWGIGAVAFVPPWVVGLSIAGLVALGAALLWSPWRPERLLGGRAAFPVLAASVFALAVLAPTPVALYGDGPILVPQVYRLATTGSFREDILLNAKSSPLAGVALLAAARLTPAVSAAATASMLYPFRVVSLLALLAALLLVWRLRPPGERAGVLLALLGSAGAVFFFGYPEMYTVLFAALLAYGLLAERTLRGEGGRLAPVLAFAAAVAAHYMALALLPTLVLLFLRRGAPGAAWHARLTGRYRTILFGMLAVLALWVPVYYAAGLHAAGGRIVMPAVALRTAAGTQAYTLWSSMHLWDLLNALLLAAPAALAVLAAALAQREEKDADPAVFFHLGAVACLGLFLLFANTSLGLARDWDITAPLGLFLVLAALASIRGISWPAALRARALAVLGLASLFAALPWTWTQLDERSALARFESVMELDARNVYGDYALSGYEGLRKQYLHRRDARKESETLRRMLTILQYPEHVRLLIRSSSALLPGDPGYYGETQVWLLRLLSLRWTMLRRSGKTESYDISTVQCDSLAADIAYQAIGLGREYAVRDALREYAQFTDRWLPPAYVAGIRSLYSPSYKADRETQYVVNRGYITPRHWALLVRRALLEGRLDDADVIAAEAGARALVSPEYCLLVAATCLERGVRLEAARALVERGLAARPDSSLAGRLEALRVRLANTAAIRGR